jgi:membrane protein YdbS with pleckstrin-like domain
VPEPTRLSAIEAWVHDFLKVPAEPHVPAGSPESTQVFRAGANYYRWCLFVWFMSHLWIAVVFLTLHFFLTRALSRAPGWVTILFHVIEAMAVCVFLFSAFLTYYAQRLNYRLRWYIITDRSLRIRTGVILLEELTMTFSNIQEIRVSAGPLQNLLKIADVEVHSAGGATEKGRGGHVGRFEGVSNANEIRDILVERLRQYRDSGLGDLATHAHQDPAEAVDAARAVLTEARALRHFVARAS